jgi:hypothetical protein
MILSQLIAQLIDLEVEHGQVDVKVRDDIGLPTDIGEVAVFQDDDGIRVEIIGIGG